MTSEVVELPMERIHLFERNPRLGMIDDPEIIISRLLDEEQVYELAKSIADKGTNPLHLIGVIRIDDDDENGEPTYVVWEGNRRVCAVMLLNDPDLAPPKWRKRFAKLSQKVGEIETIEGRIFEDEEVLRFWMRNIHTKNQKGRNQRDWGADEQHRDNPTKKYAIAFDLLELAEKEGLISPANRKGRLTTLQRFVGQEDMRAILQVDDSNPKNVKFGREKSDLLKLLKQLIADLLDETINSRKNEDAIKEYAAELEARAGVKSIADDGDEDGKGDGQDDGNGSGDEVDDEDEDEDEDEEEKPKPPTRIKKDKALSAAINKTKNDKLISLYASVTKVVAKTNTQLVAVGVWSLIETMAALCGAKENQAFTAFFNKGEMQNTLQYSKKQAGVLTDALERISKAGNTTKHDAISATFDHMQLINDMERVSPMLAKALKQWAL